jgi:hypothetical protein
MEIVTTPADNCARQDEEFDVVLIDEARPVGGSRPERRDS